MNMQPLNSSTRSGALYIRVSTAKQDELSPDAQKRLLLEYAVQNHIQILEPHIYIEDGISGRKADKRPRFLDMIAHAKSKEHPFDVILVWKFSRFARNQEESIVYKSMLRRDHVEVISISEPLADGPFGSLIERIIEWMDEYYSIRLSGEVFRGMTENAMRGHYQARPPLGYQILHHKEGPVIIPKEAEIVQLIFNLYTEQGMSMYDIAKYLNAHGYQTSRKKPFERRSIDYILHNQTYIGKTVWNQHDHEHKALKETSEWIIADGHHEAIISEAQFEAAKKRYESEYRPKKQRPSSSCRHWLSGIIKCSACGRTLSASVNKDKRYGRTYTYFQCYGVLKGKCAVSHQISEKKLAPKILEALAYTCRQSSVNFKTAKIQDLQRTDNSHFLWQRLSDIDKKEERIKQAYRDGIDTIEEYKENKRILNEERQILQQQIDALKPTVTSDQKSRKILKDQIKNVYDLITNDAIDIQTKNEAMKSVIDHIVYDRPNNLCKIFFRLNTPM